MTRSLRFRLSLPTVALLLVVAGCDDAVRSNKPRSRAADLVGVDVQPEPEAPPAPEPVKTREILRKTTQDIRKAEPELQGGGAREASQKIKISDPITVAGSAYVSIIGRTSISQIEHAVNLYHAEHDAYPKDRDQFMKEIIKPNGIRLPTLPYYQEYGYLADEHRLVVLEYPDKKAQ